MWLSQGLEDNTVAHVSSSFPPLIQGELHMKFITSVTDFSASIAEYLHAQHAAKSNWQQPTSKATTVYCL